MKPFIWIVNGVVVAEAYTSEEIFEIAESKPEEAGYIFQKIGQHKDIDIE